MQTGTIYVSGDIGTSVHPFALLKSNNKNAPEEELRRVRSSDAVQSLGIIQLVAELSSRSHVFPRGIEIPPANVCFIMFVAYVRFS